MLIDAVIYCGEKDFYRARLDYLADVVDKFIVIESKSYHNGVSRNEVNDNGNYRNEVNDNGVSRNNVSDFAEDFKDHPQYNKIVYKLIDCNDCFNDPVYQSYNGGKNFAREEYQRNYISTVLKELGPFNPIDKIVVADVDEIPNVDFLRKIKDLPRITKGKPYAFIGMKMFYYNHKCMMQGDNFFQSTISPCNYVMNHPNISKQFRMTTANNVFFINAGWHLSYFTSTENIIKKISHFLHNNWYTDEVYHDPAYINERICNGKTLFDNRGDTLIEPDKCDIPAIFLQFENYGKDS